MSALIQYAEPVELIVPLKQLPPDSWFETEYGITPPSKTFIADVERRGVVEQIHLMEPAAKHNGRRPRWKYDVVNGYRRIMAWRDVCSRNRNVEKALRSCIWPAGWDFDALRLVLNTHRADNPASDYIAITRLIDQGAWTVKDIVRRTGMAAGKIKSRLRVRELPAELLAGFIAGKIPFTVALDILKLSDAGQAKLIALLAENGKITAADVVSLRSVGAVEQSTLAAIFSKPDVDDWMAHLSRLCEQICTIAEDHRDELQSGDWGPSPIVSVIDVLLPLVKGDFFPPGTGTRTRRRTSNADGVRQSDGGPSHAKREVNKPGNTGDKQSSVGAQLDVCRTDGVPAGGRRRRKADGAGGVHDLPATDRGRRCPDRASGSGGKNDGPAGRGGKRPAKAEADAGREEGGRVEEGKSGPRQRRSNRRSEKEG